ncbi:MAG TPA: FAD-dependent oxidoreductase [Burkholderiaceae bacterium]|jgi:2-polyprenyl-6-methoxyphenol hydroxylase-like FAD-dependent oxidoreductase|nr:FAD-dependent oxidoreductase [Burkholderiaceae bacterium]
MKCDCVIAGGGPAGMMLGFLLARSGVDVVVLEKHADFLRDFRGDTIHPSTLDVMHELGLLDDFLRRPHDELRDIAVRVGAEQARIADFRHVPTHCKFLAMMPQWDFLDFLAEHARRLPSFRLLMRAEATALVSANGRVAGLRARTPEGEREIRAALVVGADGRHSTIRAQAGLETQDLGAPMDVMWLRVSRVPGDPPDLFGQVDAGRMLVMIARGDYWQCALLIPKGSDAAVRARGLAALHDSILGLSPWLGDRVKELVDWDQVKLLSVTVDRLREWAKPGLLCIGDAAHAMSPIGGVGINLAVQDAVAAARLLAGPLREHALDLAALQRVQQRREWPMRVVQGMQLAMQDRLIRPILAADGPVRMPWFLRLLGRFALLRRIPAWFIGVGVRPEHVG